MNLVYRLEKTDCVLVKKEHEQVNFVCGRAVEKDKNTLANVACAQEKMNPKGEKAEDALANLCCG